MLDKFVLDGTVTLVALAVLGLEIVVLLWLTRAPAKRRLVLANGLSGVFLILALRSALLQHSAVAVAIWLGLGFLAHIADLIFRLRR